MKLQQMFDAIRRVRDEVELSVPQFADLADFFSLSTIAIESDGVVSSVNEMAADLLGFTVAHLRGSNFGDLLSPDGLSLHALLERCRDTQHAGAIEIVLSGRSGRRTAVSVIPLRSDVPGGDGAPMLLVLKAAPSHHGHAQGPKRSETEFQAFANRLMLGHEIELKRVASELHDGIGQDLAMIKFKIEDAARNLKSGQLETSQTLLGEAVQYMRETSDTVRRLSSELWPSALADLGLVPALEGQCRRFEAVYDTVRLERTIALDETKVPMRLKSEMFRVFQEALANTAKHAQATNVKLTVGAQRGYLVMSVADNGVGFDYETLASSADGAQGLGLRSMRERAEASGGFFSLRSQLRHGTKVEVSWKLEGSAQGDCRAESVFTAGTIV